MNTHDKGAIVDGFEDVASLAAANEGVSKSEQEDDGIVIATPSESWVLLDSKSDDEEVTLDNEASTASRRQPGLIAAALACALVVAAAGAFAATRPSAVVKPPPPPPPAKRFGREGPRRRHRRAVRTSDGAGRLAGVGGGRAARGAREALRDALCRNQMSTRP